MKPTLNSGSFGMGYLANIAEELYLATSTKPLGRIDSIPSTLLPYLNFIYSRSDSDLVIRDITEPTKLIVTNTNNCVVGFSGGKDSLASALLAKKHGYDPILFHITGLNRAWPDEVQFAKQVAEITGFPLVIHKITVSGTKTGIPEPVTKNQIIMATMVNWAIEQGIGNAFSMGMVIGDSVESAHPFSYLHDTYDAHLLFTNFLQSISDNIKTPLFLRGVTESTAIVAGYPDRRLLHAAHGCMAQMRFRPGLRRNAEKKFNVRLLPGRCGVSCGKCANEYVILSDLNALEPEEYNVDMYKAAKTFLGTHPLYAADIRPDLAKLSPKELAARYVEPQLLEEFRRPKGSWPTL